MRACYGKGIFIWKMKKKNTKEGTNRLLHFSFTLAGSASTLPFSHIGQIDMQKEEKKKQFCATWTMQPRTDRVPNVDLSPWSCWCRRRLFEFKLSNSVQFQIHFRAVFVARSIYASPSLLRGMALYACLALAWLLAAMHSLGP